ncbi:glycosyltransferase [Candidatus Microgenomates bacterium]|jgi:glycosyltransferase involved in cell wall biosynthesis|nr:glycosyltransferase [Candidatus Microgenomates bacterium]
MEKRKSKKYELISVSHFFPPKIGGLENMAYNLIEGISEKGIKSIAVFSSPKRYFEKGQDYDRLSFKTLNIFDGAYPIFGLPFIFKMFNLLVQNPDSKVLIHSRHLTSSLITAFLCTLTKHPYTVIEHNAGPTYLSSKFTTNLVNWADKNIFVSVLENAEDIIAVSQTGKEWISKNFNIQREKINVIYNSFNTEFNTRSLVKKENIVVFASKWIKVKDPQTTLLAYKIIAQKYPSWRFIIVGEGKDLKYEEKELPKNITIIDKLLKQKDLFNLLKKSKIYISSSLSEGLALGTLEAVSFGNIPVLSDAKSNLEIASQLNTKEFTFTRKNYKELAKVIEKAIFRSRSKKYVRTLIEKNKEIFSKEKMIEDYYSRLLPIHYKKSEGMKLSIVMPVYNEEKTISKILKKIYLLKLPFDTKKEIIIVNDKSTDRTFEFIDEFIKENKAKDIEYVLLSNKRNLGKSQSVKKGVLTSTGDLVVTQDADLEYKPKDLISFLNLFDKHTSLDVIYGNRFNYQNEFSNIVHSFGNRFLTFFSNIFTAPKGFAPNDMETCYKMVRGDILRTIFKTLESKSNFGLEPEITAKLVRYRKPNGKRLRFRQLDIYYKPRTISQGKKMRWFKNGFEALLEILYFNTSSFTVEEKINGKVTKRQF